MLYWLLTPFIADFPPLRLFTYISFRAAGAAVTSLLLAFVMGPPIIRRLRVMRVRQGVRNGTPATHASKADTPTMGGLIILVAAVVPTLLWTRLDNRYVLLALLVTAWMGAVGFVDDYLKLRQRWRGQENVGLVERYKLAGQIGIGVLVGYLIWRYPLSALPGASTTVPFFKYVLLVPVSAGLAWLYVVWVTLVIAGTSNAVNLTDGLDGLAAGLSAIALSTLALFAYLLGRVDASAYLQLFYLRDAGELTVYCMALVGACLGFLWFNTHPAQVFMGDTGALALGGAIGAVAILLKSELLLVLIGGVFVAETMSVILQRLVFKYRRRRYGLAHAQAHRLFRRAPLHHHFELCGWHEAQVVVRFWILGILCAFLALTTLKIR
ncbi:MAG TPA: phospho-N-acetylmuramoyl-pentapeptide-transferase [Gemmatimonadaceae bacterium]|nr:phospho-N-acetylmuramoyl-pentapeptide-transferase [Gemmatimonadaceae bacterium]